MLRRASNREQVFVRHVDSVYRLIYSAVGNREDAEDLTMETFLRIAVQPDGLRPLEVIDAAILMTGLSVLADHFRRSYAESALLARDTGAPEDVREPGEPPSLSSQPAKLVKNILDRLPVDHRRILELRFLRGSSVADTAREFGLTPQHVLELQRRALAEAAGVVELRGARDETPSSQR